MNKKIIFVCSLCLVVPTIFLSENFKERRRSLQSRQVISQTVDSMFRLTQALAVYCQKNNGKLSPMNNSQVLEQALRPYAPKPDETFVSPASGQPFMPNASLVGRTFQSVPDNVVLFYDPRPTIGQYNTKGLYRVVGLKDHASSRPEECWGRLKEESGIR